MSGWALLGNTVCRCHSAAVYAGLVRCPACGHRSFDPWIEMCERRRCGYVVPDALRRAAVLAREGS